MHSGGWPQARLITRLMVARGLEAFPHRHINSAVAFGEPNVVGSASQFGNAHRSMLNRRPSFVVVWLSTARASARTRSLPQSCSCLVWHIEFGSRSGRLSRSSRRQCSGCVTFGFFRNVVRPSLLQGTLPPSASWCLCTNLACVSFTSCMLGRRCV